MVTADVSTAFILGGGQNTGSIESVPLITTSFLVLHKGCSILLVQKERKPAGDEESSKSSYIQCKNVKVNLALLCASSLGLIWILDHHRHEEDINRDRHLEGITEALRDDVT